MTIFTISDLQEPASEVGAALEATREAHHRIANHFALIASVARMRAQRASGGAIGLAEYGTAMEGLAANIEAAARLHRQLSEKPTRDRLEGRPMIEQLCSDLQAALLDPHDWTLVCRVAPRCMFRAGQITPICIIITELVTNAVKYAHPSGVAGALSVDVGTDPDGSLVVRVCDDGVGLPEGFDLKSGRRKGLAIVRALAMNLKATFTLESDELGTTALLVVPRAGLSVVSSA